MAKRKSKARRLAAQIEQWDRQAKETQVRANLDALRNGKAVVGRIGSPLASVQGVGYSKPRDLWEGQGKAKRATVKPFAGQTAVKVNKFEGVSMSAERWRVDPSYDPKPKAK